MNLKEIIERDLKAGKSLDDSLLENNKCIEDLLLEILKENRELNKRIEESEKSIQNWLLEKMSPW